MVKPPKEPLPFSPEHSAFAVPDGTKVIAVSDLHIGISHREKHGGGTKNAYSDDDVLHMLHALVDRAGSGGHMLLVGDIFEMVYRNEPHKETARSAYAAMVESLIETCREAGCRLHYVDGNHDDGIKLIRKMQALEEKHPEHFSFHPVAVRIGALFATHGDLVLRSGREDITIHARIPSREKHIADNFTTLKTGANQVHDFEDEPLWQRVIHAGEAAGNAYGVQRILQAVEKMQLPNAKAARRIWEVLTEANRENPALLDELRKEDGSVVPAVRRVVTGHTHLPYTGISLNYRQSGSFSGKYCDYFDNTGTALLGKTGEHFNPLEYTVRGKDVSVERLKVDMAENRVSIAACTVEGRGR